MRKLVALIAVTGALSFPACDSLGQALGAHKNVVARAAGHTLTVDDAASLLQQNTRLPDNPQVVDALANLWVDYTLLATAAEKDSTLKSINLQPLVKPALEQEMVWKLRDRVIHVDTALSDADLQKLYAEQAPGTQVRARHILFRLPPDATPAQRDSIMKLAQSVRAQVTANGGKTFAELAQKYSDDPGSKAQGGELGFFGKGQMVGPFETAAFKLQPGQVSDVVETPFGLHIIQVEERKQQPFEQMKVQFRQAAIQTRMQQAESQYVNALTDTLNIKLADGALEVVKDLARKPETSVSGRTADRALVTYKGGALTGADFLEVMRSLPAQQRTQFASAPDDQLKNVLQGLARNKILIAEAKRQGLSPTKQQQDSLTNLARQQLANVLRSSGLAHLKPASGQSEKEAIDAKVRALITGVVKGEQNIIPLGPLSFALREQFGANVYDRAYPNVVAKVQATRPAAPAAGFQMPNPVPVPTNPPAATPTVPPATGKPAPPPVKK